MIKAYATHEIAYKKIKEDKIHSWEQFVSSGREAIDHETLSFLNDVFSMSQTPRKGECIEIGCGTGPILRWICSRGFAGLGVDISKTAIRLAEKQTDNSKIQFKQLDACENAIRRLGKFDVAVDGHCLHCIIKQKDRNSFLRNIFHILKRNGVIIIMSMCTPMDRVSFHKQCINQLFLNNTIYIPFNGPQKVEGYRTFNNQLYIPTRRVLHWKKVIQEVKDAGFEIAMLKYIGPAGSDPFSTVLIMGVK